jgi:CBS domain-containing protein
MKKRIPVSKIMTSNLVLLNLTDTLEKAEGLFKKHNIRHIPVINNNKVEGMLSYTDLLRISIVDDAYEEEETVESIVYNMFTLKQVMVKSVTCVNASDSIYDVAKILAKENFHALPVEENGNIVGIVTTTDLITYLLEQY